MIGIYKIISPSKKVYVGQSTNLEIRFKYYKQLNCKRQRILYKSFLKHGVDKHKFEIVTECQESELNELERYYQDLYSAVGKNGMNCVLTKASDRSGKMSDEMRKNLSIALKKAKKGKPAWNRGRRDLPEYRSAESLKRMGEKNSGANNHNYGKRPSQETINKMLASRKGFKHSEESKRKIRESCKGIGKGIPKSESQVAKLRGKICSPEKIKNSMMGHKDKKKNISSKYIGVAQMICKTKRITKGGKKIYVTKRFRSKIGFKGEEIHCGNFPFTPEGEIAAAKAYDAKSKELYKEFAVLNFKD